MSEYGPVDEVVRPGLPEPLLRDRVIVVLRSQQPVQLDAVVSLLVEEGFTALELALTTPNAMTALRQLKLRFGSDVAIGAGTVITSRQVEAAMDAGASFLLAPTLAPDACAFAAKRRIPFVPGAFTPTEVLSAWDAGAAAVKLFPAHLLGPEVISSLRAPMPEIEFIPTGGIDGSSSREWLSRGALAVGVGSPLLGDALEGGDLDALRARGRALRAEVAAFRSAESSASDQVSWSAT